MCRRLRHGEITIIIISTTTILLSPESTNKRREARRQKHQPPPCPSVQRVEQALLVAPIQRLLLPPLLSLQLSGSAELIVLGREVVGEVGEEVEVGRAVAVVGRGRGWGGSGRVVVDRLRVEVAVRTAVVVVVVAAITIIIVVVRVPSVGLRAARWRNDGGGGSRDRGGRGRHARGRGGEGVGRGDVAVGYVGRLPALVDVVLELAGLLVVVTLAAPPVLGGARVHGARVTGCRLRRPGPRVAGRPVVVVVVVVVEVVVVMLVVDQCGVRGGGMMVVGGRVGVVVTAVAAPHVGLILRLMMMIWVTGRGVSLARRLLHHAPRVVVGGRVIGGL